MTDISAWRSSSSIRSFFLLRCSWYLTSPSNRESPYQRQDNWDWERQELDEEFIKLDELSLLEILTPPGILWLHLSEHHFKRYSHVWWWWPICVSSSFLLNLISCVQWSYLGCQTSYSVSCSKFHHLAFISINDLTLGYQTSFSKFHHLALLVLLVALVLHWGDSAYFIIAIL